MRIEKRAPIHSSLPPVGFVVDLRSLPEGMVQDERNVLMFRHHGFTSGWYQDDPPLVLLSQSEIDSRARAVEVREDER